MTKEQLLDTLASCAASGDFEVAHYQADKALLEFINDRDIDKAFNDVPKWYA